MTTAATTDPTQGPLPFDADLLTSIPRVSQVVPSPCGTWLAVAVSRLDDKQSKYVSDLWRVTIDGSAAPIRLTRGNSKDTSPRFRADGALGFLSDRNPRDGAAEEGDDKRMQVWILPVGGGEPEPLTDEPLGVSEFRFGGPRLVVLAEVLPGVAHAEQRAEAARRAKHGASGLHYRGGAIRHWDHWIEPPAPHLIAYSSDGGERQDLTPLADREHRDLGWGRGWDLAADGSAVAITVLVEAPDGNHDGWLRIIDPATGSSRDVGAAPGVAFVHPVLSADGTALVAVHQRRIEAHADELTLWHFGSGDDVGCAVAADWDCWPTPVAFSPDGASILAVTDTYGHHPIYQVQLASGEVSRLTAKSAGGSHLSVHFVPGPTASMVVGIRHTLLQPPEPFIVACSPESSPRLLANLSGYATGQAASFATAEVFDVAAADGARIQTFLLKPKGATGPLPLQLWIHGGPMSQHVDGWHWRWNVLAAVARGYAVALPNPRGSTGCGQRFIDGVYGNQWGGACYTDLMALTDALEARPDLDPARFAALGGSFGGYMVNWIGGNTARFRCIVSHAGLFHFGAFHGTTDGPGYFRLEMGGTQYDTAAAEYDRYSPHTVVGNHRTPTLIIHGEKDYRVPVSEGLMLFEALKLQGTEVELLVFPDENHWILKPQNSRQWYRTVLDFVDRQTA